MSNNTRERASAVNQASSATTHAVADLNTLLLSVQQEVKEIKQALTQQNKVLASASVMAKELLVKETNRNLLREKFRTNHEPSKPEVNNWTTQVSGNTDAELFKATKKAIKLWLTNQRSYFRSRIRQFAKKLQVSPPYSRDVLVPIVFAYHNNVTLPNDYEIARARVALEQDLDEESAASVETAPANNNNKRKATEVAGNDELEDEPRPTKKKKTPPATRNKNGQFALASRSNTSHSGASVEEDD